MKRKNKMLTIIALITAVLFVFNGVNIVSAATPTEERHFTYLVNAGEATITNYTGNSEGIYDVVIPNVLGGFPVTTIGSYSMEFKNLTSVIIPDSVVKINYGAFGFNDLTTIIIPNSVTFMDGAAFSENLLTSVIISSNITEIGVDVFSYNQLTNVIIPEGVTSIGTLAFNSNQLTNIIIPESVTSIGDYAFYDNQLTSVKFLSSSITLGADIFSLNQAVPANLIIEGYSASTIEDYALLNGFTFTVTELGGNGEGVIKTSVLPGEMVISSYPTSLSFENYEIGLNEPALKLQSPFELSIDDFTGTRSGWNLSFVLSELVNGVERLKNPSLMMDLTNVVINDADNAGLEAGLDTSTLDTFTKTDGAVAFGSTKKIISAQNNNLDATTRHYFNFPTDSLQIGFDNTTKSGTFTGITTFTLIASP
jgi:hypothetical protein